MPTGMTGKISSGTSRSPLDINLTGHTEVPTPPLTQEAHSMSHSRPFDEQRALEDLENEFASLNPTEQERMLRRFAQPGPDVRCCSLHVIRFLQRHQAEVERLGQTKEPTP